MNLRMGNVHKLLITEQLRGRLNITQMSLRVNCSNLQAGMSSKKSKESDFAGLGAPVVVVVGIVVRRGPTVVVVVVVFTEEGSTLGRAGSWFTGMSHVHIIFGEAR